MDLHKLISGPDCVHHKRLVPDSQQKGSAKYCAILPSVELNVSERYRQDKWRIHSLLKLFIMTRAMGMLAGYILTPWSKCQIWTMH